MNFLLPRALESRGAGNAQERRWWRRKRLSIRGSGAVAASKNEAGTACRDGGPDAQEQQNNIRCGPRLLKPAIAFTVLSPALSLVEGRGLHRKYRQEARHGKEADSRADAGARGGQGPADNTHRRAGPLCKQREDPRAGPDRAAAAQPARVWLRLAGADRREAQPHRRSRPRESGAGRRHDRGPVCNGERPDRGTAARLHHRRQPTCRDGRVGRGAAQV